MKRFSSLFIASIVAVVLSLVFGPDGLAWQGGPPPPPPEWAITTTYNGTTDTTADVSAQGPAAQLNNLFMLTVERNSDNRILQSGNGRSLATFPSDWDKTLSAPSEGWETVLCDVDLYVDNDWRDSTPITFAD